MHCKRCGREDHANASWRACPENLITKKIASWDGNGLADCTVTDAVVAGFLDADGSVGFRNHGYLYISATQYHQFGLDVLDLICTYLGRGTVRGPFKDGGEWCQFQIGITGDHDIYWSVIIGCGVIKGTSIPRLYNITDGWLGGFFAGDGCARFDNGNPHVSISQKSHPEVLFAIQRYLGYGTVTDNRFWRASGELARAFARRFADYSLHKRSDLLSIL